MSEIPNGGMFPAPPVTDPAEALTDPRLAESQRLHNWLGVNLPHHLVAAKPGETAVDVAIRLLERYVHRPVR